MRSLNIGQARLPDFNSPRPAPSYDNNRRVYSVLLAASLGYISVGYQLSAFNLASVFLWEKAPFEYELSTFQNICNGTLAIGTFIVALFISFNKIKFADYRKILILADILMIFGTLCAFGVFMIDSSFIFFGRFVCAESIAINVTCILTFVREAQFYLSQSEFKAEIRRFFGEGLFALGLLLGFASSKLLPTQEEIKRQNIANSDRYSTILLSIVPLVISFARIIYLKCLGDITSSQYAQAFTDEGLVEAEENEDDGGTLYMLKFKETKSLVKLFSQPYRRRLLICILLYLIQAAVGYFLIVFDSYYFSMFVGVDSYGDLQKSLLGYGAIFFVSHILLGFIFVMKKVSRKIFVYLGGIGGVIAAGVCLSNIKADSISTICFAYYVAVCVAFGFPIELYIEEVLPAKGIQFLQTIKWFLIGLMGILIRSTDEIQSNVNIVQIMFIVFLVTNVIAVIVVGRLVPETANLSQAQINLLFTGETRMGARTNSQGPGSKKEVSKDWDNSEDQ